MKKSVLSVGAAVGVVAILTTPASGAITPREARALRVLLVVDIVFEEFPKMLRAVGLEFGMPEDRLNVQSIFDAEDAEEVAEILVGSYLPLLRLPNGLNMVEEIYERAKRRPMYQPFGGVFGRFVTGGDIDFSLISRTFLSARLKELGFGEELLSSPATEERAGEVA